MTLKELYEKTTPGEWKYVKSKFNSDFGIGSDGSVLAECFEDIRSANEKASDEAKANAQFIAAAHNQMPALLAVVEAAKPIREWLEGPEDATCCEGYIKDFLAALKALETQDG